MAPSAIDITESDGTADIHEKISTLVKLASQKWQVTNDGGQSPSKLVGKALKERIEKIDHEVCDPGDEDPFFVADLGEVYRQHLRWKMNLKRVKPFYGMHIRSPVGYNGTHG